MVIVKDNRPVSIVEDDGFSDLMETFEKSIPGFKLLSRSTYRTRILDLYCYSTRQIKSTFEKETINFSSASVSIDHWTAKYGKGT